ncbi:hypothetical protein N5280_004033 [Vibrio vulnificus]|nr:hypothetical protein [Vibrio vulnificus]EJV0371149.1 hypothetical protein [Vibrio vulnificus]MCU8418678.1 hypothetical protein [Vibrio vulnificus]
MNQIAKFSASQFAPLDKNTVLYAVGALRQSDKARKNLTAIRSGFFASDFSKWNEQQQTILKDAEQLTPLRIKTIAGHLREAAAQRAGDNRLVKGRKSRTAGKVGYEASRRFRQRLATLRKSIKAPLVLNPEKYHSAHYSASFSAVSRGTVLNSNEKRSLAADKPLVKVQLQKREWSQQYRIQQVIETPASNAPEQQSGDRFTEKLTARAVKNIFESGAYVAVKHGGFKTFVTLTFDEERRRRVADGSALTDEGLLYSPVGFKQNFGVCVSEVAGPYSAFEWYKGKIRNIKAMNESGEIAGPYTPIFAKPEKVWEVVNMHTTIGAEVSRFINGLKKMRKRGFPAYVTERDSESGRLFCPVPAVKASVLPDNSDFHYLWVAECPANEDGEPNPHVHLLMDWEMPQALFSAWAGKIESLWGNGFAHVERIKKPEAAGTYIIKAVGYAAKGENANQGLIRGNRYNMAACSRAPKWETLLSFEADNMAGIISELGHKLDQWKAPIKRSIKRYEQAKEKSIEAAAIAKAKGDADLQKKLQTRIKRIENGLKNARAATKAAGLHVSANNRFSITFEKNAERRVNQFLKWAAGARGWSMKPIYSDIEMEDLREAAQEQYKSQYEQFLENRAWWESVKAEPFEPYNIRPEVIEAERSAFWSLYERAGALYH